MIKRWLWLPLLCWAWSLRAQNSFQLIDAVPLNGYAYRASAPPAIIKPVLLVLRTPAEFDAVLQAADSTGQSLEKPDFTKELVLGLVAPPVNHPSSIKVHRVKRKHDEIWVFYFHRVKKRIDLAQKEAPVTLVRVPITACKSFIAFGLKGWAL